LCGGDVSVRQPIRLLSSLFARTNSPGGKQALITLAVNPSAVNCVCLGGEYFSLFDRGEKRRFKRKF
jgi:hypothetical protein